MSYAYDANGNRTSMSDVTGGNGSTAYTHDELDRVLTIPIPLISHR